MTARDDLTLPRRRRVSLLAATVLLASAQAFVAGCGSSSDSGGDGGGVPAPPPADTGKLTLSVAGGESGGVTHAWVTLTGVALNADATKPYDATDASWTVLTPAAPVTLDLAAGPGAQGVLTDLLTDVDLATGTYGQIRLLVADPDAALTAGAAAQSLHWNDQVDYLDTFGVARSVPLEFASVAQGLVIPQSLVIALGSTAVVSLEWDPAATLVRRESPDGLDRFTVRPTLHAYDRARTGAVMGIVDSSDLCGDSTAPDCIADVRVEADYIPTGSSSPVRARSTSLVFSSDHQAAYFLYPLPDVAAVDLVIRGTGMDTMVVRQVPVAPTGGLVTVPTQVGSASAPLLPVKDAATHTLTTTAATTPPASRSVFQQSPGATLGSVEVGGANTDPATGQWVRPLVLPAGPLQVATYATDGFAFAPTVPVQGAGGYAAAMGGPTTYLPDFATSVAPSDATWTAPVLAPVDTLTMGHLSVHVSGSKYLRGEMILGNDRGVVGVYSLQGLLLFGGTVEADLLTGADALDPLSTQYTISFRLWQSSDMAGTLTHFEVPGVVDMRNTTSTTLSVTLP